MTQAHPSGRRRKAKAARPRDVLLRDPAPGDIGWSSRCTASVFAREYGWDSRFEALVADIAGRFLRRFQPEWERCWIAELDGERVGSVFVMRKSATVAQLRMLILAPQARGAGLGSRLTRRMHRLRPQQALSQARALDQQRPGGCTRHLCGPRLRPQEIRALRRLRPFTGRRDLGAQALARAAPAGLRLRRRCAARALAARAGQPHRMPDTASIRRAPGRRC